MQNNEQQQIDLLEIAHVLLGRFWVIVFAGIFAGICGLILTKVTTTPMYTSSTKIYILNKNQSDADLISSDLSLSATLANDYSQLIKDRTVMEGVISELGLSMGTSALASRITVTMPNSGRIITISASDPDPYMACRLASTVRDVAALHIKEVMNSESVNVVEEANIPQGQALYGYKRNGLLGLVAGMAIAIGIIVLRYMINDTIKRPEDVERYTGLSVLGSIPVMEDEKKRRKAEKRRQKKLAKSEQSAEE